MPEKPCLQATPDLAKDMPFTRFNLDPRILRAITKVGYREPTPIQSAALPRVMSGEDLTAIAQTGTGKTAAFVWPILHRFASQRTAGNPLALILVPTRELALQVSESVLSYGRHLNIRSAAIFGGVEDNTQRRALRKGADVLVATPGRLLELMERGLINFSSLQVLVLDEADRMLDMGFLGDIEKILGELPKRRQTLMFSATFSKEIESLAKRFQHKPRTLEVGDRSNPADTVAQSVYEVPLHLKNGLLLAMIQQPKFTRVLVFVKMKDQANRLTEFLKGQKIKASRLHSSRSQEQRLKALEEFKQGTVQVLVATDIVARGIDIENVSHVINFDFPVNPDDYIHRIGRTGRAESQGQAISFVTPYEQNLLQHLEFTIGQRLVKKTLRKFDYRAPVPPRSSDEVHEKRDWRKRTRERDAVKPQQTKKSPTARKAFGAKSSRPATANKPKKKP